METQSLLVRLQLDDKLPSCIKLDNIPLDAPVSSVIQKLHSALSSYVPTWGCLSLSVEDHVLDASESITNYEYVDVTCVFSVGNFLRNFIFMLVFMGALFITASLCLMAYGAHRFILGFTGCFLGGLLISVSSQLLHPSPQPWTIFDLRAHPHTHANNLAVEVLRLFVMSFSPTFRLGDAVRPPDPA
jgi:hypothetical protein